jgi:hypothetical protein
MMHAFLKIKSDNIRESISVSDLIIRRITLTIKRTELYV